MTRWYPHMRSVLDIKYPAALFFEQSYNEGTLVLGAGRTHSCSLNKSDIPNGCHAEFWSFHGYQVPSNPQLTLEEKKEVL